MLRSGPGRPVCNHIGLVKDEVDKGTPGVGVQKKARFGIQRRPQLRQALSLMARPRT